MLPKTRAEAKKTGSNFYFTDEPCKFGHIDKRRTDSGRCLGCEATPEYRAAAVRRASEWLHGDPDRIDRFNKCNRERIAEWRKNNPEEAKRRDQTQRNNRTPEQVIKRAEAMRNWREHNKHHVRDYETAYKKQWRIDNLEKARLKGRLARQRRTAREMGAEGFYTVDDVQDLMIKQEGHCTNPFCCIEIVNDFEVDHIIPLVRGGSNWPVNIQLLCPSCNSRKHAMTMDEFIARERRTDENN